ncbi:MAG: TonB-dependent receptor domain-containing protein, partial [Pseudomonadales bacterium]
SGRLGISWSYSDNASVYATVSRSFVGLGADLSRTGNVNNAFLDPTTAEAFEVGTKSMLFDNSLQLNAAVFVQQVEDLQTSALLPGTINTVNLNAGDLDIFGAEFDLLWAATDILRLSASVSYTDAEVENLLQPCWPEQNIATGCSIDANGNPTLNPDDAVQTDVEGTDATNTPELKYNLGANLDVPLSSMPFDLYGSVNYVWQDDIHFSLNDDPLLTQDSYGILNFSLGLVDKEDRYDLSIFGKNVTDEEFVNDASESSGFIARRYVRVTRGAQAFYGIRLRYNF